MNRYQNIQYRKTATGKRYYKSVKYPPIPRSNNDLYAYTTEGDRYDILANQFYKDSSLWWIISLANATSNPQGSLYPPLGVQIRIPTEISAILYAYNALNQ
tara:strand:- start:2470 stop:2772 length:303 start_codon:yes stop_codon:yes gene_type:complete